MKNKILIDSDKLTVTVNKTTSDLTRSEYLVLQTLMQHQGQVLTPERIAELTGVDENYIRNVAQKLRTYGLKVPRVSGYILKVED